MAVGSARRRSWNGGLQNRRFLPVDLVMLVGLSSKNAILIVEFAEQLRGRGLPLSGSGIHSATIRCGPSDDVSGIHAGGGAAGASAGRGRTGRHSVGTRFLAA